MSLLKALDGRSLVETPDSSPCVSPEVENYFAPLVVKKQRRDREMSAFDTLESSESNGMSPPMVNSTSPITPESSGIHNTIAGTTPFVARKKPMLGRISISSGAHSVGKLFMADIWQDDDPDTPDVVSVREVDSGSTAVETASPSKTLSPSDALDMMIKHGGRDARLYQDGVGTAGQATTMAPKRHRDQWKAKWSDTKRHSKDFFKKAKRTRGGAASSQSDYSWSDSSFMEGANDSPSGASASISGASGASGATGATGASGNSRASSISGASGASSNGEDANGDIGINFTDFTGTYSYKDMVTASEGTPRACHSDHFSSLDKNFEDGGEVELTTSYERLFEKESLRYKFWKVFKKDS